MAVLKRLPLLLLFLVLLFFAWVISPLWVPFVPVSVQRSLSRSTLEASKVYLSMTHSPLPFHPGHYDTLPKGAQYVANFSVKLNLDTNYVAHPTAQPNGNVLSAPPNDTKDLFFIEYPGQLHATQVTAQTWNAYLKAHPSMYARIDKDGNRLQYLIADKQWWIQSSGGSFANASVRQQNATDIFTAEINGNW
jgi:hypothetical protein